MVGGMPWAETPTAGVQMGSLDLDSTLVERCLSGDSAAWEDLVRQHSRRVYGLCYRFTGRDSEAQDLTQDVFMRVFRSLATFRSTEGSFGTWLARLTRNLLIDHYRRTRNERVTDSIEEQLPRVEETSIILRDLQDMEYREISQILGIPEGTVKSRLNRGRTELARLLKKYRVAV